MISEEKTTIFQLLIKSKAVIKNTLAHEQCSDQIQSLQNELKTILLSSDLILLQLLHKQDYYLQFKDYVWQKLTQLSLQQLSQINLEKDQPSQLLSLKANEKIMEPKEVIRKIQAIQTQTLQIGQELNLLELYHEINQEVLALFEKLSLKKMIVFLLKNQEKVPEKIFLKSFLIKLVIADIIQIVIEETIMFTLRSIIGLAESAIKSESSTQVDLFFKKQCPEIKQKRKQCKSSLSSSIQAFLEKNSTVDINDDTKSHDIVKKKCQIKTDFKFTNFPPRRTSERRNRAELLNQRNSGCCWKCPF